MDNTEEHEWSYDCDGTYVYAPLVGLHFEANAYDEDGNDVSDTVKNMPEDQTTISFSGTASSVSNPTRAGYIFAGWYLDEDCTEAFDFSTNLNACWTVVYAKWIKVIDIYVTKVWEDSDNKDGIRPGSITVELYADGRATGNTLVLSSDNDWSGAFKDQVQYNEDGELINYTISEVSVSGYTTTISGGFVEDENGSEYYVYCITNTLKTYPGGSVDTGSIAVVKVDADTGETLAGASFTVYNVNQDESLGTFTTDENGYFSVGPLTLNYTYVITEVEAPDGYVLNRTPIVVTLTAEKSSNAAYPYTIRVKNTAETESETVIGTTDTGTTDIDTTDTGTTGTDTTDTGTEIIRDTETIAATGDDGSLFVWILVLALSGAGLVGLTAYCVIRSRRRRRF